jgi:hypothetical protein
MSPPSSWLKKSQAGSKQQTKLQFQAGFMLGLLFNPECECDSNCENML